jgi:hypothetical protein
MKVVFYLSELKEATADNSSLIGEPRSWYRTINQGIRMMKIIKILGVATLLTLPLACSKQTTPTKAKINATLPVKPQVKASSWMEETSVDSMTDTKRYSLTTNDEQAHGGFSIMCDEEGESAFFTSPLFLDSGSIGSIKVRFDNEKVEDKSAFLTKEVALLREPKKMASFKTAPIERVLLEFSAHAFLLELRNHQHSRLRARLTSFDSQSIDLDFDITGLPPKLAEIEKKCGINP